MSDNEAREETPPEYEEEDIEEDWDIYVKLKGVLLEPETSFDEMFYTKQNFTKLLKLDKSLDRISPAIRLVGDQSVSNISYKEYRILKKNMNEAHPFPFTQGHVPNTLHGVDLNSNMMDAFQPILVITYYKLIIYK